METHRTNDRRNYYRNEYLKSEHWAFVKATMLERFKECCVCGSNQNLDVHHRRYRNLYDVLPSDLVVICRVHHNMIHKKDLFGNDPTRAIIAKRLHELTAKVRKRRPTTSLPMAMVAAADHVEKRFGIAIPSKNNFFLRNTERKVERDFSFMLHRGIEMKEHATLSGQRLPIIHLHSLWIRYHSIALRLFVIARKIQSDHGIKLIQPTRNLIKYPKITCTVQA